MNYNKKNKKVNMPLDEITKAQKAAELEITEELEEFTEGTGTKADPFIISNIKQLNYFALQVKKGNSFQDQFIKLNNNIKMPSYSFWHPIGSYNNSQSNNMIFEGKFNGANYKISGLNITTDEKVNSTGFFAAIGENAQISNLGLIIAKKFNKKYGIKSEGDFVGGLAGINFGSINNCFVIGNTNGNCSLCLGGLVGANKKGYIVNSYIAGDVISTNIKKQYDNYDQEYDYNYDYDHNYKEENLSKKQDSQKAIPETFKSYLGGIAGINTGTITNCYSAGKIISYGINVYIGGGIGNNHGLVEKSSSACEIQGNGINVAGLIGYNDGHINNCSSSGSIFSDMSNNVGGLVGFNQKGSVDHSFSSTIVNCQGGPLTIITSEKIKKQQNLINNTKQEDFEYITDYSAIGGLIGSNYGGSARNSYASGVLNSNRNNSYNGSLIGINSGQIVDCFSSSPILLSSYDQNDGQNDDTLLNESNKLVGLNASNQ